MAVKGGIGGGTGGTGLVTSKVSSLELMDESDIASSLSSVDTACTLLSIDDVSTCTVLLITSVICSGGGNVAGWLRSGNDIGFGWVGEDTGEISSTIGR